MDFEKPVSKLRKRLVFCVTRWQSMAQKENVRGGHACGKGWKKENLRRLHPLFPPSGQFLIPQSKRSYVSLLFGLALHSRFCV
ncbi:MAG: hypothetical protein IKC31_03795 [Clostridia bacterium]|nr:hypothetical protein [Clostridia bacterium]